MKKLKLLAGAAALTATIVCVAAKDPVLMKVAGIDVPLSEFEYLYNKNNRQQVEQQSLEEYLEVFKLYKQKVADALAMGKDTLPQFKAEYAQYRHDLAMPFLADSAYIEQLAKEEFNNMSREAEAFHIMRFKARNPDDNRVSINLLDSVAGLIAAGNDFKKMASTYSQDRGSMNNGGRMGWITAGRFPYAFEKAVYELPEGKLSGVVESPMGYHLILGGAKRPSKGVVKVAHIFKMVPRDNGSNGMTLGSDAEAKAKASIDSIYALLQQDPSQFETLALKFSEDKQSARDGGKLPEFGTGEMVEEFSDVAFSLAPGEISKPFRSPYGWHIIKGIQAPRHKTYDEVRQQLIALVTNPRDIRGTMVADHQRDLLMKEFKGKYNESLLKEIRAAIVAGGVDSTFVADVLSPRANMPVYTFDKQTVTVGDVIPGLAGISIKDAEFAQKAFDERMNLAIGGRLYSYKETKLEQTEPDYRNLLREFHDGSLLYEAGKDKVWDASSKDTEGLKKYFDSHRNDYSWKEPRAKGLLIQTVSDSISNVIRDRVKGMDNDSIVNLVRKEFSKDAKVERFLVPKGTNKMVDNLVFGGERVEPSNAKYKDYFVYNFKMLEKPEEVNDVRGLVISDYQMYLEKVWEEELKAKYPVEVDPKVLKKTKISKKK